jgi:hypothetical protein
VIVRVSGWVIQVSYISLSLSLGGAVPVCPAGPTGPMGPAGPCGPGTEMPAAPSAPCGPRGPASVIYIYIYIYIYIRERVLKEYRERGESEQEKG